MIWMILTIPTSMLIGVIIASLASASRCGECKARRMAAEYEKIVKENDDD